MAGVEADCASLSLEIWRLHVIIICRTGNIVFSLYMPVEMEIYYAINVAWLILLCGCLCLLEAQAEEEEKHVARAATSLQLTLYIHLQ